MKVSIITVCFNSSKTILDTINSVNQQSYSDVEHIFIDGLSSDNTLDIIKLNSTRKKIVVSEKDGGLYHALNKGVNLASGDIIGFVHSDDLLASTTVISKLVSKFLNEKLDGVYGDLQYVNEDDTTKVVRLWKSRDFTTDLLRKGWMPAHPTFFLKKEVYKLHGKFNLKYKIAADYDFMVRVLKNLSLNYGYLPCVITKMRVGGISNGGLKNIILKSKEDYEVIISNKIGGLLTLFKKNISKLSQFIIR